MNIILSSVIMLQLQEQFFCSFNMYSTIHGMHTPVETMSPSERDCIHGMFFSEILGQGSESCCIMQQCTIPVITSLLLHFAGDVIHCIQGRQDCYWCHVLPPLRQRTHTACMWMPWPPYTFLDKRKCFFDCFDCRIFI